MSPDDGRTDDGDKNGEIRIWHRRTNPLDRLLANTRQPLQHRRWMSRQIKNRNFHQSYALSIPAILTPVKAEASNDKARRSSTSSKGCAG